ncbi:MAG: LamG-like jellyroll fold domain-containing protein [Muribaculaceae bacterium]
MRHNIISKVMMGAALLVASMAIVAENDIFVFRNGNIIYEGNSTEASRVDVGDDNITVNSSAEALFSGAIAEVDSIVFDDLATPKADLLDVVFGADGTATDVSPMHNTVIAKGTKTYFNDTYNRYVANFDNTWGATATNFFRVDYEDNPEFCEKLMNGHTLEALVMANPEEMTDVEAKFFSSHQGGGTGLMVCKTNKSEDGENELALLTSISDTGENAYRWAISGIKPENGRYYHVVGVFDKNTNELRIYVDGVLKAKTPTAGDLFFPSAGSGWFAIGADPSTKGKATNGWTGDIAIARVYSRSLSTTEVGKLWKEVKDFQDTPVADILDVRFNNDGTATDISPLNNEVQTFESSALTTYYNTTFKRYVARFDNAWGAAASGYYKADYEDNQAIKDALADGHTMEAIFTANYDEPLADVEAKFFASHQGGGTGFLICKTAKSKNGGNEIVFLPNVSTNGKSTWRWAVSGIQPEKGKFYHVVGVYNKEEEKAKIYVDGQLMGEANAPGDYFFTTTAGCNWFAVGADASDKGGGNGWKGDVAVARVYDKALNDDEIALLWKKASMLKDSPVPDLVSNISYANGLAVCIGDNFTINGTGFAEGDVIKLENISDAENVIEQPVTLAGDNAVSIVIAEGTITGAYRMTLHRGIDLQDLGIVKFEIVDVRPTGAQVIAHRGYWDVEGAAQNSLQAIRNAQALNVYGSELDVWLTTDGHIMMNHDASFDGVTIQDATYDEVKDLTLSNGEKMPQLADALALVKDNECPTKLIIEIKTHSTLERNLAVAEAVVNAVAEAGVQDKVEYIAFSLDVCKKIVELNAEAHVAYLNGDMAPADLKELGIMGIDYSMANLRANMQWIKDAIDLGMTVNVWTVNSEADMIEFSNAGAQFITTNAPLTAIKVHSYYTPAE